MGVLRVDHPDIVPFIRAKEDPREFTNFNLSVALTDAFMEAVEKGLDYTLVNPRTGEEAGRKNAGEIFDLIVECAWKSGEPGVLYIDRINEKNPTPQAGAIEATNPCGEQPLLAYEPCNLGSINVAKMVKKGPKGFELDYKKLERTIRLALRFLDNVIDVNRYPVHDIEVMARGNRKVGLGVMGLADLLVRLGVPYDGERSLKIAEGLMQFIKACAWETSRELAAERGPFPNIKGSVFDRPGVVPVRNATTTTIAPTGTLSIIADCSSGIEPYYSLSYTRRVLGGVELYKLNPLFKEIAEEEGFFTEELMEYVAKGGSIKDRPEVPDEVKKLFVTAFEVSPENHIRMQAAFQKHTDNAVSKTINLPPGAAPADVREAYLKAYELGCKGVTVYRSGTRSGQVLSCKDTVYC
jgi:ribonucleoside-diphosphate reductase alpha chain